MDAAHRARVPQRAASRVAAADLWLRYLVLLSFALTLVAVPASAVVPMPAAHEAQQLTTALRYAQTSLGIPPSLLAPLATQQRQVAAAGHSLRNGEAAARYTAIRAELRTLELTQARAAADRAAGDLVTLRALLVTRLQQGYAAASAYAPRLDAATLALRDAVHPTAVVKVGTTVRAQIAALHAMPAAHTDLQAFAALLDVLPSTSSAAALGKTLYAQDAAAYARASTAAEYQAVQDGLAAHRVDVLAALANALPTEWPSMRATVAGRIQQVQAAGGQTAPLEAALARATRLAATAESPRAWHLAGQVTAALTERLATPLQVAQAQADLRGLQTLVAAGQQRLVRNPFYGDYYPAAYEYASADRGYGKVEKALAAAKTPAEVANARAAIAVLHANLSAMLANMDDRAPVSVAHAADLRLMQRYGTSSGKTIVVSLREQAVRLYDQGKLVYWAYTTTGQPARPTPPGLYYALEKASPTIFVSSEPTDSPLWFKPTPIDYAILYAPGGFFLHDAPWRKLYGPGTNLPHVDPEAFNGGSHGCVNFTKQKMAFIYHWAQVGTPILLY